MKYYFHTTCQSNDFESIVDKVTAELKKEGFGVLTQIDVKTTFKNKLDIDFRPYRILGACNPHFAHQAISKEPNIGVLLPCNFVVQQTTAETIDVSAVDPVASMSAVENEGLEEIANEIRSKLQRVIAAIS